MKLSKRAEKLNAGRYNESNPAILALLAFASQNSGIDPRNYFDPHDLHAGRKDQYRQGRAAFNQERRSISEDWARFKAAFDLAAAEGVTDAQVIEASKSAFSGRLTWKSRKCIESRMTDPAKYGGTHEGGIVKTEVDVWDWEFTTGQYFCVEYRKAAASVLEQAIQIVRRSRPPEKRAVQSIAELQRLNEQNGGCWFGKGEIRFFGTKIESGIIRGKYFISSEQPPHGPRMFSVRSFDETGSIGTVGEFCAYSSKAEALRAIPAEDREPVTA